MNLSFGMMVDGNSRLAMIEVLREGGWRREDLEDKKLAPEILESYRKHLYEVYVKSARWCVDLGEHLLGRLQNSDYAIFVYNWRNGQREHFDCIAHAIREVCPELIERLGRFGPVCLVGSQNEKDKWFDMFPKLQELEPAGRGNRTIMLTGFEHGLGEDPRAANVRDIGIFVRSTQARLSGMYLKALADAQIAVLSHHPYRFCPKDLAQMLIAQVKSDVPHDAENVYPLEVYEAWAAEEHRQPEIRLTSNAFPPETRPVKEN